MKSLTIAALLSLLPASQSMAGCEPEAVVAADAITVALQRDPGSTEILVEFTAGTPSLTRNGLAQLRELSETLREQPDLHLVLRVAPSASGLAARRARVVARELDRLDVPPRQYEIGEAAAFAAIEAKAGS